MRVCVCVCVPLRVPDIFLPIFPSSQLFSHHPSLYRDISPTGSSLQNPAPIFTTALPEHGLTAKDPASVNLWGFSARPHVRSLRHQSSPNMVFFDGHTFLTEEEKRLKEDRDRSKYWKKWGSYLAERQWATGELS